MYAFGILLSGALLGMLVVTPMLVRSAFEVRAILGREYPVFNLIDWIILMGAGFIVVLGILFSWLIW